MTIALGSPTEKGWNVSPFLCHRPSPLKDERRAAPTERGYSATTILHKTT